MKATPSELLGTKISRLTVVAPAFCGKPGRWWLCHCDCGGVAVRSTSQLRDKSRKVKSCGCAVAESIRRAAEAAWQVTTKWRGPHKQKLKWLFGNMKRRCYNPRNSHFRYYGGRGITIHDTWLSNPAAFYDWAIDSGYSPGLSIERIDNDGNYEPGNCKFILPAEQSSNTRRNRFLTHCGKRMTISNWARAMCVKQQALQHRVNRNWSEDRIFNQPFRGGKK
jgi:hypothetical protein